MFRLILKEFWAEVFFIGRLKLNGPTVRKCKDWQSKRSLKWILTSDSESTVWNLPRKLKNLISDGRRKYSNFIEVSRLEKHEYTKNMENLEMPCGFLEGVGPGIFRILLQHVVVNVYKILKFWGGDVVGSVKRLECLLYIPGLYLTLALSSTKFKLWLANFYIAHLSQILHYLVAIATKPPDLSSTASTYNKEGVNLLFQVGRWTK